jgi:hypothetical protein
MAKILFMALLLAARGIEAQQATPAPVQIQVVLNFQLIGELSLFAGGLAWWIRKRHVSKQRKHRSLPSQPAQWGATYLSFHDRSK